MALQWVILLETDAERDEKLRKHIATFPSESEPLVDSAISLGGKPRDPHPEKKFIPVGHISLETEYEDPRFADNIPGLYFIATFYISAPLQGTRLGRAAMDAMETMATSEPLCAKTLAPSTATGDRSTEEKWAALGRKPPKVATQD